MREILFKAKRADGKGWAEGLPVYNSDCTHIDKIETAMASGGLCVLVIPETVCEYTNLDEQWLGGARIFQSDKLYNKDIKESCVVVWLEEKAAWGVRYEDGTEEFLYKSLGNLNHLIGNIHD